MEAESWTRFSAASKRRQSTLQSRFDLFLGFDDVEGGGGGGVVGDDDPRAEYACPFCAEDFDIVGLCCHIDEDHPLEARNGMGEMSRALLPECLILSSLPTASMGLLKVCPVCAARVGLDMVSHITTQHGNIFKMQCRRRFRRGSSGAHSTLSLLRKELREGNLQSLFGASSFTVAPSNAAPDPLLSSFITNLPIADPTKEEELETLDDRNMVNEASEEKAKVSSTQPALLSDEDQEERARRSEFVQGLVLSTIFEDVL